jgi:pilus assembly protein CpaB
VQALIPPGMRAITIQVNEWSGVAGLLTPGSRVDIISVVPGEDKNGSVARTVVQNAEIRAIGRQVTATPPTPQPGEPGAPGQPGGPPAMPMPPANNVTLLVTPAQAEAVQLASSGGAPWLVLRNSKDGDPVESKGTTLADLRGVRNDTSKVKPVEPTKLATDPFTDKPVKAPAAPKTRTVKFIRGTKETNVEIEVAPQPPAGWTMPSDNGLTATTTDPADADADSGRGHGFNK